jgi:hemolysin III
MQSNNTDLEPKNAEPRQTTERRQTQGEEIANSVSHGLGLALALFGTPFLLMVTAKRADGISIAAAAVFGVSMMLLYGASMLYHALPHNRAKRIFKVLDHSAIYLLIAGTYTPFMLGVMRGPWGWTLFGLVWGLAFMGVILKSTNRMSHPYLSTGLYLLMGWLVLIAIKPLIAALPAAGLWCLVAGGLAYTAGVVFYVGDSKWRYGHFVWHLFVLAGTVCHFMAVYGYAS